MNSYRTSKVFVPGGLPVLTYNPRNELKLEDSIKKAKDNLCKLMIVTGATKSGKTVLVKNVFPKQHSVWFDGGLFLFPSLENRTTVSVENHTTFMQG